MNFTWTKEFEKKAMMLLGKFNIVIASCFFFWACWFPFHRFALMGLGIAIYTLTLGIWLLETKSTRF
jgi:hypothetical protein